MDKKGLFNFSVLDVQFRDVKNYPAWLSRFSINFMPLESGVNVQGILKCPPIASITPFDSSTITATPSSDSYSIVYSSFDLIQGAVAGYKLYICPVWCCSRVSVLSGSSRNQARGPLHSRLLLITIRLLGGTTDHKSFYSRFHVSLRSRIPEIERSPKPVPLCHATTS